MGGKHHLLTHVLGSPGSGKKQLLHVLVLTGTVWLCHQSPGGDVQPRYVAQWELSQGSCHWPLLRNRFFTEAAAAWCCYSGKNSLKALMGAPRQM